MSTLGAWQTYAGEAERSAEGGIPDVAPCVQAASCPTVSSHWAGSFSCWWTIRAWWPTKESGRSLAPRQLSGVARAPCVGAL